MVPAMPGRYAQLALRTVPREQFLALSAVMEFVRLQMVRTVSTVQAIAMEYKAASLKTDTVAVMAVPEVEIIQSSAVTLDVSLVAISA